MGLTVVNPPFKVQVTIDFQHRTSTGGEQDSASTTVMAPWVTSKTMFTLQMVSMPTTDHDNADWYYEQISLHIENVIPGTSFDVCGYAPNNSWGQYLVNVVGE